jgi:hypothetical protein
LPTNNPPTRSPTSSPTPESIEARLPEIKIDILTVVDDVFSFAALLIDEGDASSISDPDALNNREGLNSYFEDFVVDLLIASEVVPSSSLNGVEVDIKLLPLEEEDDDQGTMSLSSPTTTNSNKALSNGTPMRIAIEGNMHYHLETDDVDIKDDIDMNVMLLEDKMSHTLAVYFTFWRTDEMLARLSEYGLPDPHITAVRVDDKLILVAAESNLPNGGDTDSGTIGDTSRDNDNLLVVPTDIADGTYYARLNAGSTLRSSGYLFTLAAMVGSTAMVVLAPIILA